MLLFEFPRSGDATIAELNVVAVATPPPKLNIRPFITMSPPQNVLPPMYMSFDIEVPPPICKLPVFDVNIIVLPAVMADILSSLVITNEFPDEYKFPDKFISLNEYMFPDEYTSFATPNPP